MMKSENFEGTILQIWYKWENGMLNAVNEKCT